MSIDKSAALIFLHGEGASGPREVRTALDCLPLGDAFEFKTFHQVADEQGIALCTPIAREIAYTPSFGESVPAWFNRSSDYHRLGRDDIYEDRQRIQESLATLQQIITEVAQRHRFIFIGGFGMGGELVLQLLRAVWLPASVVGVFSISSI